jgi:hypothetical protein
MTLITVAFRKATPNNAVESGRAPAAHVAQRGCYAIPSHEPEDLGRTRCQGQFLSGVILWRYYRYFNPIGRETDR